MEETLGKRIVSHRKRLGLTQDQLAERLGITAQAVSKWENDQSCPDITMLPRLAEIFGITVDALLGVEKATVHEAEVVIPDKTADAQTARGNFELKWTGWRSGNLSFAALMLLVGGLMLAGNLLSWDMSFWGLLWPSALLVYGLLGPYPQLGSCRVSCILLGGFFLANELDVLPPALNKGMIFPLLLLLFGASLLASGLRKPRKRHIHHNCNKRVETIRTEKTEFFCETAFGEDHRYIELPLLSHGQVTCSFGELTVDLSGCAEATEDCCIEADCSFGEIQLLLPRRFRAEIDSDTAFGGVEISGTPSENAATIRVDCSASFGAITICYI